MGQNLQLKAQNLTWMVRVVSKKQMAQKSKVKGEFVSQLALHDYKLQEITFCRICLPEEVQQVAGKGRHLLLQEINLHIIQSVDDELGMHRQPLSIHEDLVQNFSKPIIAIPATRTITRLKRILILSFHLKMMSYWPLHKSQRKSTTSLCSLVRNHFFVFIKKRNERMFLFFQTQP